MNARLPNLQVLAVTTAWLFCLGVWAGPLAAQNDAQAKDSREKILQDQIRLEEQYQSLEEKLFSLYQYEQNQNPARSQLLQQAYQESKEKLTLQHIEAAVRFLQQAKMRDAEQSQQVSLEHLKHLLELLQREDRSKRVREDIDRFQEYLNEVNRILRVQQGIRGQTENGSSSEQIKNSQQKNSDRTGRLADDIQENEEASPAESSEPGESDQPSDQKPADAQPGQPPEKSNQKPGQPPSGEGQDSGGPPSETPPPNDASPPQAPNPVRQRLQQAQQKMQQALEKLEQAQGEESVEDMRDAERELAEAKRELEEILRQLREEEIERTLASLEKRFRQMLEQQVKIYDQTLRLGAVEKPSRTAEFEIAAGKLAVKEKALVAEANRALLLLQDDGTSIAIPETVRQMQMDMQQTAERLSAAKVDEITQEIEQDIIETLNYLIEAFAQAQEQQDNAQQTPPGGGEQPPGEQPLVDQLAELKLIRGLQQRINNRHKRYAKLLEAPNDPIGQTDDPSLRSALLKLSERQQKIFQVTRDIVLGKNR